MNELNIKGEQKLLYYVEMPGEHVLETLEINSNLFLIN